MFSMGGGAGLSTLPMRTEGPEEGHRLSSPRLLIPPKNAYGNTLNEILLKFTIMFLEKMNVNK